MIIARTESYSVELPEVPSFITPTDVDVKTYTGLYSADSFIFAQCALPHQDDSFLDKYFVTLSLSDGFVIGDTKARNLDSGRFGSINDFDLEKGDIFIVDPRTTHWLYPRTGEIHPENPFWVGLQWEVERRKLTQSVKKIVAELGARSVGCEDRRYARMLAKVFP